MPANPSSETHREFLTRIATGEKIYPMSWRNVAMFTSRRDPREIDVEAFERFRVALFEKTGIEVEIVGAEYGCTRSFIIFRKKTTTTRSADGSTVETTRTHELETNLDPMLISEVMEAIRSDEALSRALLDSGYTQIRSGTDLDVASGRLRPGESPEVLININNLNIVQGDAGVVGSNATVHHMDLAKGGPERGVPPGAIPSRAPRLPKKPNSRDGELDQKRDRPGS